MRSNWWKKLPKAEREEYRRSEALAKIDLPENPAYPGVIEALIRLLDEQDLPETTRAARALVRGICRGLQIPIARVKISGERPDDDGGDLYGIYEPADEGQSARITVWMRTSKRSVVVAPRTFIRTLLHEVVHHVDMELFDLPNSYHTKGFYQRESSLYRVVVRGTPLAKRARAPLPRPTTNPSERKPTTATTRLGIPQQLDFGFAKSENQD